MIKDKLCKNCDGLEADFVEITKTLVHQRKFEWREAEGAILRRLRFLVSGMFPVHDGDKALSVALPSGGTCCGKPGETGHMLSWLKNRLKSLWPICGQWSVTDISGGHQCCFSDISGPLPGHMVGFYVTPLWDFILWLALANVKYERKHVIFWEKL